MQVVDFKQPEELASLIDLSLRQDGTSQEDVLDLCKKTLRYSVHTGIAQACMDDIAQCYVQMHCTVMQ